jgi:hypothetical protein
MEPRHDFGMLLTEPLGEPPDHRRIGELRQTVLAHDAYAFLPERLVADLRRSVGQHQPLDAIGRVRRDPQRDDAAD